MSPSPRRIARLLLASLAAAGLAAAAEPAFTNGATFRLYDGVTAYVLNPDGQPFTATLDLRDWNVFESGPREALVKIYAPDGSAVVRRVIEDDGVGGGAYMPETGGWDHEMWYYVLNYGRGSVPMLRWSSFTDPARLALLGKRSFTFAVPGGQKGTYRVMIVGSRDHVATLTLSPSLAYGLAGHAMWMHGHGDQFGRTYVYVPRGTIGIHIGFAEFDQPVTRRFTVTDAHGGTLWDGPAAGGFSDKTVKCEAPGQYDEQILTVDVSDGPGDYMLHLLFTRDDTRFYRGKGGVPALFAPDARTAKALQGGAIYHDGRVFWHAYQVRLHDWIKANIKPEDLVVRDPAGNEIKPTKGKTYGWSNASVEYKGLPSGSEFVPLNGAHEPPPLCDTLMHSYAARKNPGVLNVAIKDLEYGLDSISIGDMPIIGPWMGNLGYVFGTYSFHYWRPAWRIIRQSDAPQEVKDIIREAIILCGDRLAFARSIERTNGNALSHIPMALRYACEGAQDPLLQSLYETYFDRFANGGWGRGVGIGKSGDCQEHFAHDFHYGTYITANYRAVITDLNDARFKAVRDRILELYSYLYCEDTTAYPWGSRTAQGAGVGRSNTKTQPGEPFTVSVNGGDEWFAARRPTYYVLSYHGRLTPEWLNNYFATKMGYGGGVLCQLTVPGKGTVLASTLTGSYGEGMEPRLWPSFHINSVVGTLADGRPLVAADSEHLNAKLSGATVTGDGEVRDRPVHATRSYTYEDAAIACHVHLGDTHYREALWGKGPPAALTEAYEMIPFVSKKGSETLVTAIGADGRAVVLDGSPISSTNVVVDRGGYGVRIELDQPRAVKRGANNTVLIALADKPVPPDQVKLDYRLVPYVSASGGGPAPVARSARPLARIAAPASLSVVPAGLDALPVRSGTNTLALIRCAVAGADLAVFARVTDRRIFVDPIPWKGSCIEVFGAMPGAPTLGQVFLAPAVGATPAKGYLRDPRKENPVETSGIRVRSAPAPDGYELAALIPLADLTLDPAKAEYRLEFQMTVQDAKGTALRGTAFGSLRAYESSMMYAPFVVDAARREVQP